ncbi:MAG: hypothetical protein GYA24_06890 [Candidatus Lokiarchaeota archaeon]|nr:hypothetical protein [Candidatus Lokiarchaeota archaeon]
MVLFFGIVVLVVFMKRRKKASISRALLGVEKINERDLARLANIYVEEAHAYLHDVSRDPDESGIAILVKGEYIYFANEVIKEFKKLYKEGKNTKELLEAMSQFETREEVKKVLEKLKEFEELPKRKLEEGVTEEPAASDDEPETGAKLTTSTNQPFKGIHPAFPIAAAAIAVILIIAACAFLNNGTIDIIIVASTYHAWLEEISNATGYGMLALGASLVLGILSRRKALLLMSCMAMAISLVVVLYINEFRPYMDVIPVSVATDALQSFKTFVGSFEALVMIATIIGIVAEIKALSKPKR